MVFGITEMISKRRKSSKTKKNVSSFAPYQETQYYFEKIDNAIRKSLETKQARKQVTLRKFSWEITA
ncbi:hypothetical protein [Caulobacter phage Cr30]|uniref:hypothetical protein n=1 Tax=Caulobacter phage Cr30 TaxID=1357714 RepID=UPI0004A9B96F|nr:hypothetical protein OZ74_gp237 [Caulobacter phage Cr30]AGS81106.1 hypothetical protein [Caulobacter phage Cr30]